MLRKMFAVVVVACLLVAAAGMPVLAGAGLGRPDERPPEGGFAGPPEFVTQMQQHGIMVMARESIRVRGQILDSDLPPVIKEGRVLVPVRAIAVGLGADVEWDAAARMVTITKGDTVIVLYLDDLTCLVNGEEVEIDVPGQILGNRTFVPLRFIAQTLGVGVMWNAQMGTVDIIELQGSDEGEDD